MDLENKFQFSNESFTYLKKIAKNRYGIDFDDYRKNSIYNRLVKRLRFLKLKDFDAYCNRLNNDISEEIKFINLITNPSTSFFREKHHFEYLRKYLQNELLANQKKKIRIWSAGCSTGEEAYSIAMVILETIPNLKSYDIKILATDINSDGLSVARSGHYEFETIKKLSPNRRQCWLHKIEGSASNLFEVNNALKELITFRKLNLNDPWPMHGPFDIIFCRNVIIYFNPEARRKVLARFDNLLKTGSILILGYSENLNDLKDKYTAVGKTCYKKIR